MKIKPFPNVEVLFLTKNQKHTSTLLKNGEKIF